MEEPSTTSSSRIRTLRRLLVVLALAALVAVGIMWWRAPSASWACGADDTESSCLGEVTLDLGTVGPAMTNVDRVWLGFNSFDISPDGSQAVVGLHTVYERSDNDGPEGGFVAIFDTATGEAVQTLFDTGAVTDGGVYLESVSYSPDGSLIAIESSVAIEGAVTPASTVQVFDVVTGESTEVIATTSSNATDCPRLGISPDNRLLQCNSVIFDIATGEVVEVLDNETRYSDYNSRRWAWSRTGITADPSYRIGDDDLHVGDDTNDVVIPRDDDFPSFGLLSFNPDASVILVGSSRIEDWSFWSLQGPRRNHPDLLTRVFDPQTGDQLGSFFLGTDSAESAWNEAGDRFATIDDDLRLSVYAF